MDAGAQATQLTYDRVGMTMRSIAVEEDVIVLRGWGAMLGV